jgi:hypothetical protein
MSEIRNRFCLFLFGCLSAAAVVKGMTDGELLNHPNRPYLKPLLDYAIYTNGDDGVHMSSTAYRKRVIITYKEPGLSNAELESLKMTVNQKLTEEDTAANMLNNVGALNTDSQIIAGVRGLQVNPKTRSIIVTCGSTRAQEEVIEQFSRNPNVEVAMLDSVLTAYDTNAGRVGHLLRTKYGIGKEFQYGRDIELLEGRKLVQDQLNKLKYNSATKSTTTKNFSQTKKFLSRLSSPSRKLQLDQYLPNDPQFQDQWGLDASSDNDIDAPEGWKVYADDKLGTGSGVSTSTRKM